jgi:hypothetical protein
LSIIFFLYLHSCSYMSGCTLAPLAPNWLEGVFLWLRLLVFIATYWGIVRWNRWLLILQ